MTTEHDKILHDFNVELSNVSSNNLFADARGVVGGGPVLRIFDEEGRHLFNVPHNTPPIAVFNAWRAMVHSNNESFQRGRKAAFKQIRELIGAQGADDED